MRTLSRPMFNWGGPVKQGVMHGIREPYKHGTQAALVGNPVYPKTGGREHHGYTIPLSLGWAALQRMLGGQAVKQVGQKVIGSAATGEMAKKGIQESIKRAAGTGTGTGIASTAPAHGFFRSAWEGDPMVRSAKWLYRTLKSPTAKSWGQKAAKTIVSPTGALTAGWFGYPAIKGAFKKEEPVVTGVEKPGGYPGGTIVEEKATLSKAQRDAFALAERNKRVQKYLDLMGYDRSKKTAIADALIDASKIVSDRGTLDKKNITQELINPIIQATSKRLDKPDQIREAVGLMMTKAGLEKEMYDAKPGTIMKNAQDLVKTGRYTMDEAIAIATKGSTGVLADIQSAIAAGKVGAGDWVSFIRATGAEHGENVEVITDEQIKEKYKDKDKIPTAMEIIAAEGITNDGIYVLGSETVRIKDGKVTQLR